ncbi:MAG: hypothetical protein ACE5EG_04575, partial [Thermoanaerobaculia bacterium]
MARGDALDEFAIPHHKRSVDQHILDSFGHLHRIAVGCPASHRSGIEDRQIGIGSDLYPTLLLHLWCDPLQPLSGLERHL